MPITDLYLVPEGKNIRQRVISYHIDFDQDLNERTGEPLGSPILTQLSIRIERNSQQAEPFYIDWQLEHSKQEDLDLCFYDQAQLIRSIKITKAYLVSYNQDCSIPGKIEETLIISPKELVIDGVTFSRTDVL
jgi:hypothetical protein